MHTILLYGVSNSVLVSKHMAKSREANKALASFETFITHTDPNVQSYKVLVDTNTDMTDKYACFCYINYETESSALDGVKLFDNALYHSLISHNPAVDTSHMYTCLKPQAFRCKWTPVFSIWVGNIFKTPRASVWAKLNSFGPLTTLASHGMPPLKVIEGPKRCAIVNFVHYKDAKAALDAKIIFGTHPPSITRPRSNVQFIQRVMEERPTSMGHVHSIAAQIMDSPADCVALMQACKGELEDDGLVWW